MKNLLLLFLLLYTSLLFLFGYIDGFKTRSNKKAIPVQHNAFRSNIVGTIFFYVEDYVPYKKQEIYKETDKYIIYSVEPCHTNVKRISIYVILRFPCSKEKLADISNEINKEAIYYEVHNNNQCELRFRGMPNNIIFSFFGYDEADIINHNYAYRSVWVDDNQDKSHLYALSSNSVIIDNIWVSTINSYDFFKKFIKDNTADDESLIRETRGCMYKMISEAEKIKKPYQ